MDNPGDVSQFFFFRFLHDWETYFNRHYQLYRRRVHVYAYNFCDSNCAVNGLSPDEATAEAADNYNHVYNGIPHMFAVDDWGAESQSYTPYLAQRGVVDFGTFGFSQKLAGQYPGRYWSFSPTYDRLAEEYASWVCTRVIAPGRVTFSGNNDHGAPRVYGLLLTDDPTDPGAQAMQKASVADLQHDCGFTASSTAYYHYATGDVEGPHSGWGAINMAQFRKAGVTTIIWPGGMEYEDMRAANAMQWYPEWVVLGDGAVAVGTQTDGNLGASAEPPDEESHVRLITAGTLLNADGYPVERPCLAALAEVDPSLDKTTDSVYDCEWYDDFRQLYTGLQLAAPT
jgi:hypothetical protein